MSANPIADSFTAMVVDHGKIATKRWVEEDDGTKTLMNYDKAYLFTSMEISVSSIEELSLKLSTLIEPEPRIFVIRGKPKSHVNPEQRHRRTLENYQTSPQGLRWIMIDLDKIKVPAELLHTGKLTQLRKYLVGLLPKEFHDASYHWQLSSKAGMVEVEAASMHLWFWLEEPIPNEVLRSWASWVNSVADFKLIDPALFAAVQPHYVAAPVFEGLKNPIKKRSGLHRGKKQSVRIVLPPPGALVPSAECRHTRSKGSGDQQSSPSSAKVVGFEAHLAQIGDHPGGSGFHNAILSAAASGVSGRSMTEADVDKLYRTLESAVLKGHRNASETAAVLGLSPYQTPYQLWLLRTSRATQEVTAPMRHGTAMEPAAREAYEALTGHVMQPLVLVDGEYSASLDGVVFDGSLILEAKCPYQGRQSVLWQEASAGRLVEHYQWQVQHQLMVSGAPLAHVWVFDGQEGLLLEVAPEPDRWELIRAGWDSFMAMVREDRPPALVDGDKLVREDEAWQQAAEEYVRLKRAAEAAEKVAEAAKGRLVGLASHTSETGAGVTVTRFWKAGNVDYKQVPLPAGVDLDQYRSPAREETRVSLQR